MDLDNLRQISKLDKENMLELLTHFPKQCEDALFIGEHSAIKESYKKSYPHIIFTGLGGSAIGADFVKDYVSGEMRVPIFVNRNYELPSFAGNDSLVFAASYSGNTEETLAAYMDAKARHAKVIVITSGGKIKDLALKNKDMLITIPKGYPPRCALGYSFIPALVMLSKLGLIKKKTGEIRDAIQYLDSFQKKRLAADVKEKANTAKGIAKCIFGKVPVIYASSKLESIAIRWRGQFAENAKTLASSHVLPEMNHNEIVGWAHPRAVLKNFVAIILKDKTDHTRVKKRMAITAKILKKNKFHVMEIESQGKTLLNRMLSLVYVGDFTSFYLSILNKTNPTPVERITYLKKQLAK